MEKKKVCVFGVQPGSIAEEAGIEPGDEIVSINGESVRDIFDYRFLTTDEKLLLEVEKQDGEVWEVEIEKDENEELGIEFENSLIDEEKSCTNRCIFCFIDQLPKGMRETVYFKDDDSRLSFLTGNYVTLTNMKDSDLDRLIRYRMSPINVSVHTTNPELRKFMLNNRFAGDVGEKIRKLLKAGIEVNCQIVLCRGINDGTELDRTLKDLAGIHPKVNSISVVPVGITRFREGLYELIPYNGEEAMKVVRQVQGWQKTFLAQYGTRLVYIADEFYLMAGVDIPAYEEYEGFPQLENGVGLVALLQYEVDHLPEELFLGSAKNEPRVVSIATGVSAFAFIQQLTAKIEKKVPGLKIKVYAIKNRFFGETVTVAGLLTGQDIEAQLKGEELGQELFITASMLKAGENKFLDDYTLEILEERLGVKITPVRNNGEEFVRSVMGNTLEVL